MGKKIYYLITLIIYTICALVCIIEGIIKGENNYIIIGILFIILARLAIIEDDLNDT
jgi:hypothetical protein